MDSTRADTPPERRYDLRHLKPKFLVCLDDLIDDVIAGGTHGKILIEVDIANRRVDRVWVGNSGKAGFEF